MRIRVAVAIVLLGGPACWAQSYTISTIAGQEITSGAPAQKASLMGSSGLSLDNSGNLFFSEWGADLILEVTPTGAISIVAGDKVNGSGFYGDGGPAVGAALNNPSATAFDSAGNLYIGDSGNNRVRKVSTSGIITTVAGGGSNVKLGGQATQTAILMGQGLAVDSAGDIFLVMTEGGGASGQVLKVAPNGIITSVAGNPSAPFSLTNIGDNGPAASAYIAPTGLAVDASGNLYLADAGLNRIRKVSTSGTITTVAGSNTSNYTGDGGPATSAGLNTPMSVAVDAAGNLYIADYGDYVVRKVTPDGTITTIAGTGRPGNSGDGGPATSATLASPQSIAAGPGGLIYVTDVRQSDGAALIRLLTPVSSPPGINAGGVVPLFSAVNTIQPGEWGSIFGSNLATGTMSWNGDFPISLAGTSVTIDNKSAYLSYVSPAQIDFQAPDDTATGNVTVVVKTSAGSATSSVTLAQSSPCFSLLDGKHVAGIILRSDGSGAYGGGTYDIIGPTGTSLGYKTVAAKAGDAVELYGVGFGPTNPSVAAGAPYSSSAPTTSPVQLTINNIAVTPAFSGITSAGLYQINIVSLPGGLGAGDVSLTASAAGVSTPTGVVLSLQ